MTLPDIGTLALRLRAAGCAPPSPRPLDRAAPSGVPGTCGPGGAHR
ncbi:hypothetical protein SSCG_04803 [Streptomyces clavuligerus]|nr:hypothetical protein SSCG_04803 [Streptomyces clavuligerus]